MKEEVGAGSYCHWWNEGPYKKKWNAILFELDVRPLRAKKTNRRMNGKDEEILTP